MDGMECVFVDRYECKLPKLTGKVDYPSWGECLGCGLMHIARSIDGLRNGLGCADAPLHVNVKTQEDVDREWQVREILKQMDKE